MEILEPERPTATITVAMSHRAMSPFHAGHLVDISPDEYEKQVLAWVRGSAQDLQGFQATRKALVRGSSGEYEIDVLATLEILGGASIKVLIECKRHTRPVEREKVMTLHAKIADVGAHKGMIFSTSGFQRGALEYATCHGIAAIKFVNGQSLYETRSLGPAPKPPPWAMIETYAGILITESNDSRTTCKTIDIRRLEPLADWMHSQP